MLDCDWCSTEGLCSGQTEEVSVGPAGMLEVIGWVSMGGWFLLDKSRIWGCGWLLQAGRESGLVTLSCGTELGVGWRRADHMMFSDDAPVDVKERWIWRDLPSGRLCKQPGWGHGSWATHQTEGFENKLLITQRFGWTFRIVQASCLVSYINS